MFDKFRLNSAKARLLEEKVYEQVVKELAQGFRRDGLWAKAMAEGNGSEERAKSIYIKLRVQSIKDEMEVNADIIKTEAERSDYEEQERQRKKLSEFDEILRKKGYKLNIRNNKFFIDEPLGGRQFIDTWQELEEYVNKRR